MPELPEVETIVRELIKTNLIGKTIKDVQVLWERIVEQPSVQEFKELLKNQEILDIKRRGKYLLFTLTDHILIVHLRMTGKFEFLATSSPLKKHEHVRLFFNDGTSLRYEDTRKFGRFALCKDAQQKIHALGIEPLSSEFTLEAFENLIKKRSSMIKPFLLDQRNVAGLGNIYVDEALWMAQIHPKRLTKSLSKKEIKALFQAIPEVLTFGIQNSGTSLGMGLPNYFSVSGRRGNHQFHLNVFRKDGMPCPRCNSVLKKIVVNQRGTHYCPQCQKEFNGH